jgi:hypothetical protein
MNTPKRQPEKTKNYPPISSFYSQDIFRARHPKKAARPWKFIDIEPDSQLRYNNSGHGRWNPILWNFPPSDFVYQGEVSGIENRHPGVPGRQRRSLEYARGYVL